VALAQKGQNPAHPPGTPSNPTGDTPNGPYPVTGAKAVDGSSAVVLGGALAGQAASSTSQPAPTYLPGAKVSFSA
jgi:hypothetical protein